MTRPINDTTRNTVLRASQGQLLYLAVDRRSEVMAATLDTVPTYPATQLDYTLTSGLVTSCEAGMTVKLYTSAGVYKGWIRLREDAVVSQPLEIAETGESAFVFTAGDIIKVFPQRRPVAKFHRYNPVTKKFDVDYDVTYVSQHGPIGPLARPGIDAIGFRDASGNCTLKFVGDGSQAYTPSCSIELTSPAPTWSFPESQSSTSLGTEASPVSITFTQAHPDGAEFWLRVWETPSGVNHTAYGTMWTFDRTGANAPLSVDLTVIERAAGLGSVATVVLPGTYDADDLPKGAHVVLFTELNYAGTIQDNIGATEPYRSNILLSGYVMTESVTYQGVSGASYTVLQISTVDELLKSASCYPINFESTESGVASRWEEMQYQTIQRAVVSMAKYRAQYGHDVHTGNYGDDQDIKYLNPPDANLWEQFEYLYPMTLLGVAGCDAGSAIHLDTWYQIVPEGDQWLSSALNLEKADLRTDVVIDYQSEDESAQDVLSGVMWQTPYFLRIPDDKFYYGQVFEQQPGLAIKSLADAKRITGRLHAYRNRAIRQIVIPLGYFAPIDANPQTLIKLTLSAADHPMGRDDLASGQLCLVTNVRHELLSLGRWVTTLVVEPLVDGSLVPDAIPFTPPQNPTIDPADLDLPAWITGDLYNPSSSWGDSKEINGEGLTATDKGLYATFNALDVFDGGDVIHYPRNLGIPEDSFTFSFVINGFNAEADHWNGLMLVESGDSATSGIYSNPRVWSESSSWELMYSDDDFATQHGGSPVISSGDSMFNSLRSIGNILYMTMRYKIGTTEYRHILISTDGGSTWTITTNAPIAVPAPPTAASSWSGHLGVTLHDQSRLYAGRNVGTSLYLGRSTDGGNNWASLGLMGSTSGYGDSLYVVEVPYEGNSSHNLIWISQDYSRLWRSINGGTTISAVSMPSGFNRIDNDCLHVYTLDSDIVTIGDIDGRIAVSTNGTAGTPTFTHLQSLGVRIQRVSGWPTDPNWLAFCTRSTKLYLSNDQAANVYDAWGNLSDYGATRCNQYVPRSF